MLPPGGMLGAGAPTGAALAAAGADEVGGVGGGRGDPAADDATDGAVLPVHATVGDDEDSDDGLWVPPDAERATPGGGGVVVRRRGGGGGGGSGGGDDGGDSGSDDSDGIDGSDSSNASDTSGLSAEVADLMVLATDDEEGAGDAGVGDGDSVDGLALLEDDDDDDEMRGLEDEQNRLAPDDDGLDGDGADGDGAGGGGGLFGLFEFEAEEVPLEEVIGLRGPLRNMFDNVGTVLASNAVFLVAFVLLPLLTGRFGLGLLALYTDRGWLGASASAASPWVAAATCPLVPTMCPAPTGAFYFASIPSAPSRWPYGLGLGRAAGGLPTAPPASDLFTVLTGYAVLCSVASVYVLASRILRRWYPYVHSPAAATVASALRYGALFTKVAALVAYEFGLFPLGCGWWLDVCTQAFVGATMESRRAFLRDSPAVSTLVHWVVGLLYMVFVSLFMSALREAIQPRYLWFLRDPNADDFRPLLELVEKPLARHARRMCLSVLIYAPLIGLLVYLPARACLALLPGVFPLRLHFDHPLVEVPADLFFLNVAVPLATAFRFAQPRAMATAALVTWIAAVGDALGIRHLVAKGAERNGPFAAPAGGVGAEAGGAGAAALAVAAPAAAPGAPGVDTGDREAPPAEAQRAAAAAVDRQRLAAAAEARLPFGRGGPDAVAADRKSVV